MTAAAQIEILVVEDDPQIASGLVSGLKGAGYRPTLATNGEVARGEVERSTPDLIILDLMLPDSSGFDLLAHWKDRISAPIIVLTARGDLDDRVRVFELGAADYVPKPFFLKEVLARIAARLHLTEERPNRTFSLADVDVDLDLRIARNGEGPLKLTKSEFNLLSCLLKHPERPFSRSQLAASALPDQETDDRVVDSHIARLRKKLGADAAKHLVTVWGIGYRYSPDASA